VVIQTEFDVDWTFDAPVSLTAGNAPALRVNSASPTSCAQKDPTTITATYAISPAGYDPWSITNSAAGLTPTPAFPQSGTLPPV
jgi:hypothetical protein